MGLLHAFEQKPIDSSPRALLSCTTHRIPIINKCFESAIAKMRGENKPFKIMFYIRRDSNLETQYYMSLFHAFEQQPIDSAVISCVPFV